MLNSHSATLALLSCLVLSSTAAEPRSQTEIGREVSVPRHLMDGEEFTVSISELIGHGQKLFGAMWTSDEGGGRPLTKGTGGPLSDPAQPLVFPRNFNRISAPDANSCAGCHNLPFGIAGGGGDIVANVFVLAQRFDFATFNPLAELLTKESVDEGGMLVTQQTIGNFRATLGMFGSGFIEMLARQITMDLQAIRDLTQPGGANELTSKGISFGILARRDDGTWDTSQVRGIPATSLGSAGAANPPSLVIRPFHQAGRVISLREFSNNAFNHHHGIQPTERFGVEDPDGDGFKNEMTRADVTAVSLFQATMAVPGRVIPNDQVIEAAVWRGEQKFETIGCAQCHVPSLPLENWGWVFTEPNPFNAPGNLRRGEAPELSVDLTDEKLPAPRLKPDGSGIVHVPAYTDFKLHDICAGSDDPNIEPLDMNQPNGSPAFFAGNRHFITRKLWGAANEPPYFHHGQYTTLRQAILAHAGEALPSRESFEALSKYEQDCVVEFLKTLQVLPPGTKHLVIDEKGRPKKWPPTGLSGAKARSKDSF